MATVVWSEFEPSVEIESVDELDRFVDNADADATRPTAVSIEAHGYRADLLVGHATSFIHLTPEDPDNQPYYVTVGGISEGHLDFWLHSWHPTPVSKADTWSPRRWLARLFVTSFGQVSLRS